MEPIENPGGAVNPPPVVASTTAARTRVSLAEIKAQEAFETGEGVWAPIHMLGAYAGELLLTYVANEELWKKYRAEVEKVRIKLCKPKGWKPEEGSDESEEAWRNAMIGTTVHDFRDWEESPGVPLARPDSQKEVNAVLHRLFDGFRTIRGGVHAFVTEQENFNLRRLEAAKGES